MPHLRPLLLALIATAACSTTGTPPADTAAEEAAIRAMVNDNLAAAAAGNMTGWLTHFTDDAVIMAPDQPALRGLEAITAFARPYFEKSTLEEAMTLEEIRVAGDRAVVTYRYAFTATPKAGGAPIEEAGKGMGQFRRAADGKWRWTHSIWNRDAPAPTSIAKD